MRVRHEAGPRQGCAGDDTVKTWQQPRQWHSSVILGGAQRWPRRPTPHPHTSAGQGRTVRHGLLARCRRAAARYLMVFRSTSRSLCPLKHAVHSLYAVIEACTGSDAPRLGASSTSTGSVIDRHRWLLARVADTMSTRSGQSIISRMCASRMHTTGIGGSALIAWSRILSSR